MQISKDRTYINKLVARGYFCRQPATRLRLSSQISHTDFDVHSMPPNAILLIRSMQDPMPEHLRLQGSENRPPEEWQHAINQKLGEYYREAERPVNGNIPSNAQALIFNDMAEYLACVCDYLIDSSMEMPWWIVSVLQHPGSLSIAQYVVATLTANSTYLGSVLENLRNWKRDVAFLKRLDRQEVRELINALLEVYGLRELKYNLSRAEYHTRGSESILSTGQPIRRSGDADLRFNISSGYPAAIYHRSRLIKLFEDRASFRFSDGYISSYSLLLTGLSHLLHVKPWEVHDSVFQQDLVSLWEINHSSLPQETSSQICISILSSPAPLGDKLNSRDIEAKATKREISEKSSGENPDSNSSQYRSRSKQESQAPVIADADLSDTNTLFTNRGITTNLGGVLYLINLIRWLDVPGCFEHNWHRVSHFSPWRLLIVFARILLNDSNDQRIQDDPLWQLLEDIDDQSYSDSETSENIETYHMPLQWFTAVNHRCETFRWCEHEECLFLWSASGYLIAKTERNRQPVFEQALMILYRYLDNNHPVLMSRSDAEHVPLEVIPDSINCPSTFRRALSYVMPYLRRGLLSLTGLKPIEFESQLLACRGQVYVTATHIDLVTPMENIAIAARRAGLDQDPGWVPMLGRVVTFHFN